MVKYLHGFNSQEQQRLMDQAGFLAPLIYPTVDFSGCKKLLEIGSGVGAQTRVLLGLFPQLQITSVDFSSAQLDKAKENLRDFESRITFVNQDAERLLLHDKFDSAFICWALEHITSPIAALQQLRTHLLPGSKIHITEVFNSTFYCYPKSPAMDYYYQKYNERSEAIPMSGANWGICCFRQDSARFRSCTMDFTWIKAIRRN
jgi:ubiquinone/menaquinone biosynthesis C-methylase UbiE